MFLAKDVLASAVLIPLYLTDALLPLGVSAILLAGPTSGGACAYLCWRILRRPDTEASPTPDAASAGHAVLS